VGLFAARYGADRLSGRAAKDHGHWWRLLTRTCPKRDKAAFFWCSSCLLAEVKLRSKSKTIEKSGEQSSALISGFSLSRFWVDWVCGA
jgi:hypothetical protein